MIEIVPSLKNGMEVTTINQNDVNKAARSAIDAIKNELQEEDQTVEVMEYVISEMQRKNADFQVPTNNEFKIDISEMDEMIKQKKIVL